MIAQKKKLHLFQLLYAIVLFFSTFFLIGKNRNMGPKRANGNAKNRNDGKQKHHVKSHHSHIIPQAEIPKEIHQVQKQVAIETQHKIVEIVKKQDQVNLGGVLNAFKQITKTDFIDMDSDLSKRCHNHLLEIAFLNAVLLNINDAINIGMLKENSAYPEKVQKNIEQLQAELDNKEDEVSIVQEDMGYIILLAKHLVASINIEDAKKEVGFFRKNMLAHNPAHQLSLFAKRHENLIEEAMKQTNTTHSDRVQFVYESVLKYLSLENPLHIFASLSSGDINELIVNLICVATGKPEGNDAQENKKVRIIQMAAYENLKLAQMIMGLKPIKFEFASVPVQKNSSSFTTVVLPIAGIALAVGADYAAAKYSNKYKDTKFHKGFEKVRDYVPGKVKEAWNSERAKGWRTAAHNSFNKGKKSLENFAYNVKNKFTKKPVKQS
jgi:hypothetical protein